VLPLRPTVLNSDVLPFCVAQFTQALSEALKKTHGSQVCWDVWREKAYARHARRRLCLPDERRDKQIECKGDREPDQPHGHLVGEDGWPESSRMTGRAGRSSPLCPRRRRIPTGPATPCPAAG